MCIFIRKCTFFSRFKKKKWLKIKKCDILYSDKGLLFHVKKCRNCTFFKTKCTTSTLNFNGYLWQFVCRKNNYSLVYNYFFNILINYLINQRYQVQCNNNLIFLIYIHHTRITLLHKEIYHLMNLYIMN